MKFQLKNNGKPFKPIKKLAIGILLLISFFLLFEYMDGTDGLVTTKKSIYSWLSTFMSEEIAGLLSAIIMLPLPIFMVYAAVSGAYRILTFNFYNPVFEDHTPGGVLVKGSDSYPNINRVLSYRESKMNAMTPDEAANLFIASSKIESLYTGYDAGPRTKETLSYIESKLAGMSAERGLNYLSNKL